MKAQPLISSGLAACRQPRLFVSGWFLPTQAAMIMVACLAAAACAVSAYADEYDIIIEKNLFHDQRQKWEMPKDTSKGTSSGAGSKDQQPIDQIGLFGTVIMDQHSYAVMRVSPQKEARGPRGPARGEQGGQPAGEQGQENKQPYAIGDFIGGYQVVEIRPESVLLQDANDKRYEIYINDGQTERSAVRTEIAEDKPEGPSRAPGQSQPDRKPPRSPQSRPESPPGPAASAGFMRQRFEKDLQMLRDDNNGAVAQQAERDWKKLVPPAAVIG